MLHHEAVAVRGGDTFAGQHPIDRIWRPARPEEGKVVARNIDWTTRSVPFGRICIG